MARVRRMLGLAATGLLLVGCAGTPSTTGQPATRGEPATAGRSTPRGEPIVPRQPIVLFGEVHDNAAGHALRLASFEAMLAGGERPALLLEQFDRSRQAAIDALRAGPGRPDPDALIEVAGGPGWDWDFYRAYLRLALDYGLPIVAANLSRDAARAVMRDGLAAHGFDPDVPEAVQQGIASLIEAGHCGLVGAQLAQRMALAQVARDQAMARAVEAHAARGAVLVAGNGHVRTDVGVPRWLSASVRARSEAIGVLERGDDTPAFDRRVYVAPQERPDPCASLRMPRRSPRPDATR